MTATFVLLTLATRKWDANTLQSLATIVMLAQLIHVMLIWAANTLQLLLTTVILAYMLLAIANQELLKHLFLVMITILAPQTVAIKPVDSVFTLLSTLTTTTLAQPTGVML
jgi:hypothetical protein